MSDTWLLCNQYDFSLLWCFTYLGAFDHLRTTRFFCSSLAGVDMTNFHVSLFWIAIDLWLSLQTCRCLLLILLIKQMFDSTLTPQVDIIWHTMADQYSWMADTGLLLGLFVRMHCNWHTIVMFWSQLKGHQYSLIMETVRNYSLVLESLIVLIEWISRDL